VLQRHVKMPIDTTSLTGLPDEVSIKSQTVVKKARKGPNRLFKGQKKKNFICGIDIPLSQINI